jgi:hypothetical protein
MKSMLALLSAFGAATLASAQELSRPLPSVVQSALPATAPVGMTNHPTNWGGNCADPQSCAAGSPNCSASRGGCAARLWNWLTFRVCEPNHESHVLYPYHARLRTYFPFTPAPIGANGPLDCNSGRSRYCGREASGYAPTYATPVTGMVIARPGYEHQPMASADAAGGERKSLMRRMMGALALDGSGSAKSESGMHFAGNSSPLLPSSPPAVAPAAALLPAAAATRPFSNP